MSKMKRFLFLLLVLTMTITAFAGCTSSTEKDTAAAGTAAAGLTGTSPAQPVSTNNAEDDGSDTLVFATTGFDTKNFNPALAMVVLDKYVLSAVFESLIEIGDDGSLTPVIAESYNVSDDNKIYTFKIRKDVKFQDGSPLTASDVKFSIERYGQKDSVNGKDVQTYVESVEKPDDYTVVVTLKKPFPFILNSLSSVRILPEKYIEEKGEEYFNTHPIGSGVYKIADIKQDISVTLEAVPGHWRDNPEYKTVIVQNIPDASTQLAMLKSGQADIVGVNYDSIAEVEGTKGLRIKNLEKTTMTTLFVQGAWKDTGEASQNLKVRRALDYAVNRDEIVKSFFNGYAIPEKYWKVSPIGENWDPNWKATGYDPEKAKQLLKEAGYPGAFKKPVIRLYTSTGDYRSKLAELIASYWQAIGLQVELKQNDETILMSFARGNPDLSEEAYGAVCLWASPVFPTDGINSHLIWYRTDGRISVIRDFKEIDSWFDEGLSSPDKNKRNEIDNKIMEKVDDELKYTFGLAYIDSLWGVSEKVGEWRADYGNNLGGFNAAYFKTIKKSK
jgi:peptide/nickel transport system substrate-binding protein